MTVFDLCKINNFLLVWMKWREAEEAVEGVVAGEAEDLRDELEQIPLAGAAPALRRPVANHAPKSRSDGLPSHEPREVEGGAGWRRGSEGEGRCRAAPTRVASSRRHALLFEGGEVGWRV